MALSDLKRTQYAQHSPLFWRKAPDASEQQARFFMTLLEQAHVIALVSEEVAQINGFVIASVSTAPPVYDPGGRVCVVDDCMVATPELWSTVGVALLTEVRRQAHTRGAVRVGVVCGHHDVSKQAVLRAEGFSLTSEWYVQPL